MYRVRITDFFNSEKDGAKQWNKGCKQGGNPYATDRGTAMAVCLEKRSGKSDLTAVSSEE